MCRIQAYNSGQFPTAETSGNTLVTAARVSS